jgi:hypothetical protein
MNFDIVIPSPSRSLKQSLLFRIQTKILYAILIPAMCATCPPHFIPLEHLSNNWVKCTNYTAQVVTTETFVWIQYSHCSSMNRSENACSQSHITPQPECMYCTYNLSVCQIKQCVINYCYRESYLRFCSQPFDLMNMHESVHLCNNAVQCKYKNGKRNPLLPDENMWDCYTFQTYLR